MRRLRHTDERGATAVVVALLLVVLVGFTSLAVDVGAVRWDQKQLQNGADAAALAIANDCAKGPCGNENATAATLAGGNTPGTGADSVKVTHPTTTSVRVDLTTTREHWFAPVLGFTSTTIPAAAEVRWGAPKKMMVLPITVSQCSLKKALLDDPTGLVHLVTKGKGGDPLPGDKACGSPSPHIVPGQFQWLASTKGCRVVAETGKRLQGDPGNSEPSDCSESQLNAWMQATEVLVPLYTSIHPDATSPALGGTGKNTWYNITGFAAIRATSYCLTNGITNAPGCNGSARWIEGYFVRYVSLADAELGASTDFGVTTVQLSK
ncbi:MAG: pilus assembly protein TadG-related protein [Arachnia sp.]